MAISKRRYSVRFFKIPLPSGYCSQSPFSASFALFGPCMSVFLGALHGPSSFLILHTHTISSAWVASFIICVLSVNNMLLLLFSCMLDTSTCSHDRDVTRVPLCLHTWTSPPKLNPAVAFLTSGNHANSLRSRTRNLRDI